MPGEKTCRKTTSFDGDERGKHPSNAVYRIFGAQLQVKGWKISNEWAEGFASDSIFPRVQMYSRRMR
jgi:hypothetical protein